jgi:bacterioferritin
MDKDKLLEALNKSIAREMQVSIQYMWQHVMAVGIGSAAVADIFKKIAIDEMKHAEKFAERINYLGGVPTTKPDPINVGGDLTKMLADDLKAEEEAIALYKAYIKLATELNDPVSRLMYEEILEAEEEHHDTFGKLLEK